MLILLPMATKNKWIPLFATQFVGVLNDNFLKNIIIFVAVFWLAEEKQGLVIPIASALLVFPFVLLSPLAGRMAQTYSKQRIYEYAKLAEIPIMALAVVGFYAESLWVVMVALLFMGMQSAIYAPSKYGLIRDVGGNDGLSYGVGTMELLTFMGVLIGQIIAGTVSDLSENVTLILSSIVMILAVAGYYTSKKIQVTEEIPTEISKDSIEPFTFTFKTAKWARTIKGLNTTVMGLGGFWLVAAMIQMNIYEHAPTIYHLSNTATAVVMALIAIGIGFGCFFAGKLSKSRVELGMVPLGGLGLSIMLTIFATVELTLYPFVVCLFFAAMFSGFYKVPLSAWIQERVTGRKVGLALAYNQLVAFLFILLAAGIYGYVVNAYDTYAVFMVLAVISWIMTIITMANIPAMMLRFVAYMITHFYFKIEVNGAENIPKKSGALLVANHFSLLDPFLIVVAVPPMLRFVMAKKLYEFPLWKGLMKRLNMIPISGRLDKGELEEFNTICRSEVNEGHVLCIFPEGQISRIGHILEFKKGIEHIAKGVEVPIIPVQMSGVKGSLLSYNIGSSTPIMTWISSFRRKITIEIGNPLPPSSKASMLRQKVQLLNAITFKRRIKTEHSLQYFIKKTSKNYKGRTFQYGDVNSTFKSFHEEAMKIAGFWDRTDQLYVGIDVGDHKRLGLIHASCLFAGKIPVFLNPQMNTETKEAAVTQYTIDCVLSESNAHKSSVHPDQLFATTLKRDKVSQSEDVLGVFWDFSCTDGWFPLALTHANFLATIRSFMHLFDKPEEGRLYTDFPVYTSYGNLTSVWLPYFFGQEVYTLTAGTDLADVWSASRINMLFTNAQYIEQLNEKIEPSDWKQLRYVITGEDSIPDSIRKTLIDHGVFTSESLAARRGGMMIAMNTPDFEVYTIDGSAVQQDGSKAGSYGRPLPGLGIRIVSKEGEEMHPNEVGEISIFGAGVCPDYADNEG